MKNNIVMADEDTTWGVGRRAVSRIAIGLLLTLNAIAGTYCIRVLQWQDNVDKRINHIESDIAWIRGKMRVGVTVPLNSDTVARK